VFKLKPEKKRILLLLGLNKENLSTRISAVLAPYNIKSADFLKKVVIELNILYGIWLQNDLSNYILDKTLIIANLDFMIPVELFTDLSGVYTFIIKLPKWGFLFSYSFRVLTFFFYLQFYKGFILKRALEFLLFDLKYMKKYYFLIRCGFYKEKNLIL
jgi:hypothetical protein